MADLSREQILALRSGERGIHGSDLDRLCAMALRLLDEEEHVRLSTVVRGVNDRETLLRRVAKLEDVAKQTYAVLMARRNALVDREILDTITPDEAWELGCVRGALEEMESAHPEVANG